MRILYILRNAEGGIRTHVELLMRGALARGHEVLLITDLAQADRTFKKSIETDHELRKRVVSIAMRSAPGPWDLITLWLLWVGLRSARSDSGHIGAPIGGLSFDVVHGHGAKGGLFARLCRSLGLLPKSTRVIYTPHGGSLHAMHGKVMNRIYVWIEKILAKSTDLVLFESRYTMEQFAIRVGKNVVPMALNRNGIAKFDPDLTPWPKDLGSATQIQIGAFGLLRTIKGFDVLIKAVHLVRKRGFQITLDIHGEGRERQNLETLVLELDLEKEVRIHPETSDAIEHMRQCHLVIQPSHFESFGLVALEAQSLGLAVIASRAGGLIEVVADGQTGLLVPPADPEALAEKIIWMIENPNETQLMRTRAAKRAQDGFSSDAMVDGAISAYKSVSSLEKSEDNP